MVKIGRNQPCPCGSGQKYKRCCLTAQQMERQQRQEEATPPRITLKSSIEKIQQAAANREEKFFELGVFIFFSSSEGDAWVLEATDQDCVQVSASGEVIDVQVEENEETIEVNWSHTFALKNKQLYLTAYADKTVSQLENAPTRQINGVIRRIRKRFTSDLLDSIHLPSEEEA